MRSALAFIAAACTLALPAGAGALGAPEREPGPATVEIRAPGTYTVAVGERERLWAKVVNLSLIHI